MMRRHHRQEVEQLVADALARGWTVHRRTRSGIQLRHPAGRALVTVHWTPTDWRALRNVRAMLRH
jgi:hypothetical protein